MLAYNFLCTRIGYRYSLKLFFFVYSKPYFNFKFSMITRGVLPQFTGSLHTLNPPFLLIYNAFYILLSFHNLFLFCRKAVKRPYQMVGSVNGSISNKINFMMHLESFMGKIASFCSVVNLQVIRIDS